MQLRIDICYPGGPDARESGNRSLTIHVTPDHLRFTIEDCSYYALPVLKLPGTGIPTNPALVSVIPINNSDILNAEWLADYMNRALEIDDVTRPEFFSGLLLSGATDSQVTLTSLPSPWGLSGIHFLSECALSTAALSAITPGPYVVAHDTLWRAYRLFDDSNGAFMVSCKPNMVPSKQPFQNLRISGESYQTTSVAVASRLISTCGLLPEYALYGKRIAVKDLYQLDGLKTSLCNKAYYDLNLPATSTASSIQRLIDAGAQIVGKTKLSSLISREEPTEAVDYQTPFNPRGDGYQSPAGSSSGSAAAIAAYEWLDFAIGSDTTGSGRRPALVNGTFMLRPSHSILPLDGITPTFLDFDTPCLFGRDIKSFIHFVEVWFGHDYIERPLTLRPFIIYPLDYLPVPNNSQMQLLDAFVDDLAQALNVEAAKLSISSLWDMSIPEEAQGATVQAYLEAAGTNSFIYEFYHSTDRFRAEYQRKYHKAPFVNPLVQWRWDLGETITKAQRDEAVHRLDVYKTWFLQNVLQVGVRGTMFILPIATVEPNYRETPPGSPFAQSGFDPLYLSPILGAPEIVVPIGELPYQSRISRREEKLPVAASLLSAPETDMWLIEIATMCLEKSSRATVLTTGSSMFSTKVT